VDSISTLQQRERDIQNFEIELQFTNIFSNRLNTTGDLKRNV